MDELLEMEKILNKLTEEKKNKISTEPIENTPLEEQRKTDFLENSKEEDNVYFKMKDFEAVTITRTGSGIKEIIESTKKEIFNNEETQQKKENNTQER